MDAPDILSDQFQADVFGSYRRLRDDYPVLYHEATNSYLISRYADCADAFRSAAFTSDNYAWQLEPLHGRTVLQMEGTEHARHRALLNPFFRGDGLKRFMSVIHENAARLVADVVTENASGLVDEFARRGSADLVDEFCTRFPINVMVDMLGLPGQDHERFHSWYSSIMAFLNNLAGDPEINVRAHRTKDELRDYILPVIAERRQHPGNDLLSRLCQAEVDGEQMTDEEIKAFVSLLLVAGGETTDKAMAGLLRNLIDHPEQMDEVRHDRDLVDQAIAETLRYNGPVHMIMRETAADVEVADTTIPEASTCILMLGAANRDERQYFHPDRFDIHRGDLDMARAFSGGANHVAFILGRHFCVGSMLAKAEMTIAANTILDRLHDIRYVEGFVPAETGLYTRGLPELPVTFTAS